MPLGQALQHARCVCLRSAPPIARPLDLTAVDKPPYRGVRNAALQKRRLLAFGDRLGAYPHAEERRLCYAAMTRARRGAYLVADALRPSAFVEGRVTRPAPARQLPARPPARAAARAASTSPPADAACTASTSPSAATARPRCQDWARLRRDQREDLALPERLLRGQPPVCESCRAGVLVARTGRFLGCSAYASDEPCTNTCNLAARR